MFLELLASNQIEKISKTLAWSTLNVAVEREDVQYFPNHIKEDQYGHSHSSSASMAQAKPNTKDLTSLKKDKKKDPSPLESEKCSCSRCFMSSGVNSRKGGTFVR